MGSYVSSSGLEGNRGTDYETVYSEATDGSSIETKESAVVWHHQEADPDFGSCQAKELLVHLENVLSNEPAVVKRGQHIVEVKPQGMTKGLAAVKVLTRMVDSGKAPDSVMKDMFESILSSMVSVLGPDREIFACMVGQKPSKSKYYLDDTVDVIRFTKRSCYCFNSKTMNTTEFRVAFDTLRI